MKMTLPEEVKHLTLYICRKCCNELYIELRFTPAIFSDMARIESIFGKLMKEIANRCFRLKIANKGG
jgi:hypothetical protein